MCRLNRRDAGRGTYADCDERGPRDVETEPLLQGRAQD
jgi:hypothetical protein